MANQTDPDQSLDLGLDPDQGQGQVLDLLGQDQGHHEERGGGAVGVVEATPLQGHDQGLDPDPDPDRDPDREDPGPDLGRGLAIAGALLPNPSLPLLPPALIINRLWCQLLQCLRFPACRPFPERRSPFHVQTCPRSWRPR